MLWNRESQDVVDEAIQCAKRFNHDRVNSGHLLAALLIQAQKNKASAVLALDVNLGLVYRKLEELPEEKYHRDFDFGYAARNLPWDCWAKYITDEAPKQARQHGNDGVSAEHLVLAVCKLAVEFSLNKNFLAGEWLKEFGVYIPRLQEIMARFCHNGQEVFCSLALQG